ncbi:hypothetical protein ACHAPJ_010517 [Fusarium lateritium]
MIPPRRSTRIRDANAQSSTESPKPTPNEMRTGKKRKASTGDQEPEESTKRKKRATPGRVDAKLAKASKKTNPKTNAKSTHNNKAPTATESPAPDDALSVLPAEILQMILENVTDAPNLLKLARTSRRYYSIVMPILHKRIAVKVNCWAHIPNAIRRIEPHLSIAQKKKLKKEGKYKGQQKKFSTRLDPDSVPPCVDYVRQMVIDSRPGHKHKYIVLRYFEEVLKNLHNLEIVKTTDLTESMSHSLVSQRNLKALHLFSNCDLEDKAKAPLAKIKNLQHLTIENNYADWEDQIKARYPDALKQPHDFTALKSLTLQGMRFAGPFAERIMPNLTRAFDFLALRELSLSYLDESRTTLFNYLEPLFSSADRREICLRSLSLPMNGTKFGQDYLQIESELECVYRFIASFDTLTSLRIDNYNIFYSVVKTYPGLSAGLQEAILKHKDLETLRLCFPVMGESVRRIPFVPASTVALLTESLPQLRVLEFPPQENNFYEMARALSQARNLISLTCAPYPSQDDGPQGNVPFTLAKTILEVFLSDARSMGEFVWEDNYKLTRLVMGSPYSFNIGSGLKPGEDVEDPVTISKGDRTVMCQMSIHKSASDRNRNLDTEWVDKVAKAMV